MIKFIKIIIRKIFLLPIHFYRKFISPLYPPCCKFYPTCSTYAVTAIERFGIIKGGWLAIKRVCRCHPWSLGGIDKVPEEYHFFEKLRKKIRQNMIINHKSAKNITK